MGNPARELLELIDSWGSSGPLVDRRVPDAEADDPAFWQVQKQAIKLLSQVEDFLRDDGSYPEEADTLAEFWIELLPPAQDWTANVGLPRASSGARSMMRQIARRMDNELVPVTEITSEQLQGLRQALEELAQQLRVIPQLSDEVRDHLLRLIRYALRLIDDDTTPPEDLRAITCEIAGATIPVVSNLPEDARQDFAERLATLTGIWFANVAAGAVGGVLAAYATSLLQITAG